MEALHRELRDFVGMVVVWWDNRKKTENGACAWSSWVAGSGQAARRGQTMP